MANWQKVIFSGSAITDLQNDSNFKTLSDILTLTQSLSSSMSDARAAIAPDVDTLSGSMSTSRDLLSSQVSGAFDPLSSSLSSRVSAQEDFSSSIDTTFLTEEELNQGTGSSLNNASSNVNVITFTKGDGTDFDVEVVQSGVDTSTASFAHTTEWGNLMGTPDGLVSGSSFSSPSQGTFEAIMNGVTTTVDTGLQTGDSPTFADLDTTGGLIVGGNLKVEGTTTSLQSATASIADKFITFASGSNFSTDGGIVLSQQANGYGQALGYDASEDIWGFEGNFNHENTGIRPEAQVNLVTVSASAPGTNDPAYGGTNTKAGQFWVDTSTNFIWISQPDLVYSNTHYLTGWSNSNYINYNTSTNGILVSGSDSWSVGYQLNGTLPTNGDEFSTLTNGEGALAIELDSASEWNAYAYTSSEATSAFSGIDSEPTQTSVSYWLWTYDGNTATLKLYYNGTEILSEDVSSNANFKLPPTSYSGTITFGNAIQANVEPMNSSTGVSGIYFSRTALPQSMNTYAFNNGGNITGHSDYDDVLSFLNVNNGEVVDLKEFSSFITIEGSLTYTAK